MVVRFIYDVCTLIYNYIYINLWVIVVQNIDEKLEEDDNYFTSFFVSL